MSEALQFPSLYLCNEQLPTYLEKPCEDFQIEIIKLNSLISIPNGSFVLKAGQLNYLFNEEIQIFFNLFKAFQKISQQRKNLGLGPLIKAIGKDSKRVVDLTCGSCVDSMYLLAAGLEVFAFERNSTVAFLISTAIAYYKSFDDNFSRKLEGFHFIYADPVVTDQLPLADCYYYDPMYPSKKKSSAKSRKEIEVFKSIVGKDLDEQLVLQKLTKFKDARIVVKRPCSAKPIVAKPTASFLGKTTRYDLYKNFTIP